MQYLKDMTKAELMTMAEDMGLELNPRLNKDDMIAEIERHSSQDQEPEIKPNVVKKQKTKLRKFQKWEK